MSDQFAFHSAGLESPASHAAAVAPSDSTSLPTVPRALYLGVGGDLAVTMLGGETVTFTNVPAGLLPVRVTRVLATGTTAAGIIAVW